MNGNYAFSAGVKDRCLVTEDKDSDFAKKMADVIAVKIGQEDNEKTRVLLKVLKQENIATFIKAKFGDSAIYVV